MKYHSTFTEFAKVKKAPYQLVQGIGNLAAAKFLHIDEMQHLGKKTICCGEGGPLGCLLPELAKEWGRRRKSEARGREFSPTVQAAPVS